MVELLIVTALTLILLALSLPAYQKIRTFSHNAKCISNLRQCGIALLNHAKENRNRLALPWASAETKDLNNFPQLAGHPQSGKNWYTYLIDLGYLTTEVVVCPAYPPHRFAEKPWGQTYGMRRTDSGTRYDPIVPAAVERPAHFVVLTDSSRPQAQSPQQWYYITYPGNARDTMHFRHSRRANIFFLDGSCRALSPQEVVDLGDGWRNSALDLSE